MAAPAVVAGKPHLAGGKEHFCPASLRLGGGSARRGEARAEQADREELLDTHGLRIPGGSMAEEALSLRVKQKLHTALRERGRGVEPGNENRADFP